MKINTHSLSYLAHFFLEREMFQTKFVEKIKTHIFCSVTFFRKSCRLWDNVEKCCTAEQATYDNMAHEQGYRHTHTHRIYNTYCFSTTTVVAGTRLSVTFTRTFPVLLFFYFFRITLKWTLGVVVKTACNWLRLEYERTPDFREWHPWSVFRMSIFKNFWLIFAAFLSASS